jgi:hypothetical protein
MISKADVQKPGFAAPHKFHASPFVATAVALQVVRSARGSSRVTIGAAHSLPFPHVGTAARHRDLSGALYL